MPRWTAETRAKHAQLMRERVSEWKPWEHSTGATTTGGKFRSSRNALKHGKFTAARRAQHSKDVAKLKEIKQALIAAYGKPR